MAYAITTCRPPPVLVVSAVITTIKARAFTTGAITYQWPHVPAGTACTITTEDGMAIITAAGMAIIALPDIIAADGTAVTTSPDITIVNSPTTSTVDGMAITDAGGTATAAADGIAPARLTEKRDR